MVPIFDDSAHRLQTHANSRNPPIKRSGTPQRRGQYPASIGRESRDTFANCQEIMEDVDWSIRAGKVHGTSNTQQERQPWHQIAIASVSYHESMCELRQHICRPFHSTEARRQFMDQRHLQNRPQLHDLGIGGDHTSNQLQPLSARIWRFAHVLRTCSPDPFAFPITDDSRESTCPVCSTTQTPQATLKIWT